MDVGQEITEAMGFQRQLDSLRIQSMWQCGELRMSLQRAVSRGLITEGQAAHIRGQLPW